jgi:hypothetical protein
VAQQDCQTGKGETEMIKIIREGFFFRAVNEATGFCSYAVTSASQAGLIIQRRWGKDAHRAAAEAFLKAEAERT